MDEEDVIDTVDGGRQRVLSVGGIDVELPLERVPYDDLMLRYGSTGLTVVSACGSRT